jgi:hypothetical protein
VLKPDSVVLSTVVAKTKSKIVSVRSSA